MDAFFISGLRLAGLAACTLALGCGSSEAARHAGAGPHEPSGPGSAEPSNAQPRASTAPVPSAPVSFSRIGPPTPTVDSTAAQLATASASGPSSTAAPGAAVAGSGACPADMVDVSAACIDRYEAPNRAGEKPLRMQTLPEAQAWCGERGKRLCTEDEWLRACQGPKGWTYPYGPSYQEHACNQDKRFIAPKWKLLAGWPSDAAKAEAQRLDQSEPSGSRASCVSPEGVFDLTGNVAEWVVKKHPHPEACLDDEQRKHRYVVQGCFWGKCYREPHEPACGYVNCSHPETFRSYEFGFRCCQDRGR
jgi:formylglycine-generating enzyme required for sulfatase activity